MRERLGDGSFGGLMDCFQCVSVWVGAPMALLVAQRPSDLFLAWFALSGAACLLERVTHEPVLIQPLQETNPGGEAHDMLRSTTNTDPANDIAGIPGAAPDEAGAVRSR